MSADTGRIKTSVKVSVEVTVSAEKGSITTPFTAEGQEFLIRAIKRNDPKGIADAVQRGADVNREDIEGRSPLHFAVRKNRPEAVRALIRWGAEVDSVNEQWLRATPLHVAAWAGDIRLVRSLIEGGADIRKKDGNQFAAIHRAAWNGQVQMVQLFLDLGVEVDFVGGGMLTPLHKASECNKPEVVRLLLDRGADPFKLDCCSQTAYKMAARRKHKAVMQVFEERYPIEMLLATIHIKSKKKVITNLLYQTSDPADFD